MLRGCSGDTQTPFIYRYARNETIPAAFYLRCISLDAAAAGRINLLRAADDGVNLVRESERPSRSSDFSCWARSPKTLLALQGARTYMYDAAKVFALKKVASFRNCYFNYLPGQALIRKSASLPTLARALCKFDFLFTNAGERVQELVFFCLSLRCVALFTRFTHVRAYRAAASELPRITLLCIIRADMCVYAADSLFLRRAAERRACQLFWMALMSARAKYCLPVCALPCVMRKLDMRTRDDMFMSFAE